MTTFLIYAAALLVSFIVLVVVAFVYVIMSEDDKNDQHKGASCSPASAGGKPPFRAASSLARHRVMATNPIISTPTASQTVRTLSFRSSPQVMMPAQQ